MASGRSLSLAPPADRRMQRHVVSLLTITAAVLAALTLACSKDPIALKKRYVESGDRYLAAGQYREAALEFRNALQQDPLAGDVREKLAESSLRAGDTVTAVREYVRAADLLPKNLALQLKAGTLLLAAGQFRDAEGRADNALATDARNVDAILLKANALIGMKDIASAIEQIQDAIQVNPGRGETYANLGAVEMSQGDREAAEASFTKAVQLAPESLEAQLALGNFYWLTGRWGPAEEALNKALAIAPRSEIANLAIANYYLATSRFPAAEAPLKTVYELTKAPSNAYTLADYYVMVGNDPAAKAVLEPLAKAPSTSKEAAVRMATIDYRDGHQKDAYARLDGVLTADAYNEKALLVKATFLRAEKRLADALQSAQVAAAHHPQSTVAYFLVGQLQAALRRPVEAMAAFEEVLRLNPRASDARLALSQLQLAEGRADVSAGLARDALKNDPNSAEGHLLLARALLDKNDLAGAEAELTRLTAQHPNSPVVQAQLGTLFGKKGNPTAAREHFIRAITIQPTNTDALAGLVAIDLASKNSGEARERLDRALSLNPRPELLSLAARTYAAVGDRTGAERLLKQAIERDASYLPAYIALGELYIGQNQLASARAEFEALSQRSPRPVPAMTMVGMILQAEGNTEAARKQFERVLQLDPKAAAAANNLAWLYAEAGENLPRALDLAQEAVADLPDNAAVNDTLGYILLQTHRPGLAIPQLLRSVAIEPKNPVYHYHLGKAYFEAGQSSKAKDALSRALALNPTFTGAGDAKDLLARAGSQ